MGSASAPLVYGPVNNYYAGSPEQHLEVPGALPDGNVRVAMNEPLDVDPFVKNFLR